MIRATILIISILNTNVTIHVLIKWCYRKKVLRNHEVKTLSARGLSCVLGGCSNNLLDKHSEWPVSWDSIAYDFSRPTCMWNSDEIFSWVFPRVQQQYSPKPIQILVNTLRPEHVWHTFSKHFLDMKLTKICSFAELVIKLVCWLTRLRHNNILPHKYCGVTCA